METSEKKFSGKKIFERPDGRRRVITHNEKPSRVDRSQAKACDINDIVSRFHKTGELPNGRGKGIYGDFTDMPDYADMILKVQNAQDQFLSLPSKLRAMFDNDPAKLVEFISDDKNIDEAIALGILPKKPKDGTPSAAAPIDAPVTNPDSVNPPKSSSKSSPKKATSASNDDD